eukprot:TRINITY_DN21371_c0_g1_i1.p3 TRINITY_DN21371_c0_g1~~TRINITY_DN21371_c0_g1_i1.p3  ORF type:complete len:126 (+),score=28.11 TRINITY_DN21371_c0_g1_i1:724-1101(+)
MLQERGARAAAGVEGRGESLQGATVAVGFAAAERQVREAVSYNVLAAAAASPGATVASLHRQLPLLSEGALRELLSAHVAAGRVEELHFPAAPPCGLLSDPSAPAAATASEACLFVLPIGGSRSQ